MMPIAIKCCVRSGRLCGQDTAGRMDFSFRDADMTSRINESDHVRKKYYKIGLFWQSINNIPWRGGFDSAERESYIEEN